MISQYWKDQIPAKPLSIQVKNQDGTDMNLSGYDTIEAVLVGSNNEFVDLTGSSINDLNKITGKIVFTWPTDRSLFSFAGDYVFQLKLSGTGKLDFTTTHPIRVKELGRIQRGNVYNR
jgi:hypothetical protein